jgi:lipid-binding SYLF domain-containing protein
MLLRQISVTTVIIACSLVFVGCATAPKSEEDKGKLVNEAAATIAQAQKGDEGLKKFMDGAAGYAVFPSVSKGGAGVGAAWGRGVLYEKGVVVGYCDVSQGSVGLQLGGQVYSELICFENQAALDKFKSGKFAFSAQATAVAIKAGAGANAKYSDSVAIFTMGEAGLMYEASVGGQNFAYQPK